MATEPRRLAAAIGRYHRERDYLARAAPSEPWSGNPLTMHAPDIELSRDDCLELLAAGSFGRVVVTVGVGADRRPLIRPVNYVFDQASQAVSFRTAEGTKLHALMRSASACFEIDEVATETRSGWSVIVYGVTEPVVDPGEIRRLEQSALDSFAPGPRAHWMRVRASTITGRRVRPAAAATG